MWQVDGCGVRDIGVSGNKTVNVLTKGYGLHKLFQLVRSVHLEYDCL